MAVSSHAVSSEQYDDCALMRLKVANIEVWPWNRPVFVRSVLGQLWNTSAVAVAVAVDVDVAVAVAAAVDPTIVEG